MAEYICKNGHKTKHPRLDTEARMNDQTKEWELHILCKECGESLEIEGKKVAT